MEDTDSPNGGDAFSLDPKLKQIRGEKEGEEPIEFNLVQRMGQTVLKTL